MAWMMAAVQNARLSKRSGFAHATTAPRAMVKIAMAIIIMGIDLCFCLVRWSWRRDRPLIGALRNERGVGIYYCKYIYILFFNIVLAYVGFCF
jgi:hypothetical protein